MSKLFTATWCGPCSAIKKELETLQHDVELIDVDQDVASVVSCGIRSVPSLVLPDGRVVAGAKSVLKELRGLYGKA